jgi:hypothetical protein
VAEVIVPRLIEVQGIAMESTIPAEDAINRPCSSLV